MTNEKKPSSQKRLGIVLSGGGARGLAHIGILKILLQNQIEVSYISGCSMGGLMGALYALGYSIDEIESIARKYTSVRELINLVDRTPRRRGLIVGHRLRSLLSKLIGNDTTFGDTKIPLVLNAVDLISSQEVVLDHGNLLDAVMATTAVPGFFAPVNIEKMQLIDGGTLNNLPVNNLGRFNPEVSLAVDVHPDLKNEIPWQFAEPRTRFPLPVPDFLLDLYRAQLIMATHLTDMQLEKNKPDLLIRPNLPPEINTFYGYQRADTIIKKGEECALENLDKIKGLL